MGAYGPKLYQDDIAEDVRDYYIEQLHKGKIGKFITSEMINQNKDTITDVDDAPIFWFALAETQWSLGRLEELVKEQALNHIRNGKDLRRWESENPRDARIRVKVLAELEQKLLSPQPTEKKMSQYNLYKCEWKINDVFAYKLESDLAKEKGLYDKYFLMQKIDEAIWHPGHVIPIVRVKLTKSDNLPTNEQMFDKLEYVQISNTKYEDRFLPFDVRYSIKEQIEEKSKIKYNTDAFGYLTEYLLKLISTSKKTIPKKLIYIGNFTHVKPPMIEFIPHDKLSISSCSWKNFETSLIESYCGFNLKQYGIYLSEKK